MEIYPQKAVEHVSLTTTDDIIEDIPTSSIVADNEMDMSEHDIEGHMSLSNSLWVEEE